jgi:hypothetical protein
MALAADKTTMMAVLRFRALRMLCAPARCAQLSPYRRDGRQLAQTRPPSSRGQRRVLNLLDQARPAFGERPLDRPPLPIVDFQFQMSRSFGACLAYREIW